jgi:penicillin G amidase
MKFIKYILSGFVALVLVMSLIVYIYLHNRKPILDGAITMPGLTAEVTVHYDAYGVPHIYAATEEDAYYALGYVHAQDRLFQMEMLRRAAGGRLSEILGADLVKVDKLFRTLSLNKFAKEQAKKFLSADTAAFQRSTFAYQKGINHFINTGATPIEFAIIGIPKTAFTPEDIYLAVGFMSFGFAEGLNADPVLEKIRTEFGAEYLADLAVHTPPDAVRIKNFNGSSKPTQDNLISAISNALDALPVPLWQGSNGWVISSERSASGFPVLSNDTHIGFAQPSVWYEAHIEYPGKSFYGHHIAGIPFGLLGNNRFCGIGLTMFENDDSDFFIETTNPVNEKQVKFRDTWEDVNERIEVITVKDSEPIALTVRTTRHGPIINGILENTEAFENPVALSWQLLMMDNYALQAAYQLNHATTFAEARDAVSKFSAPGLNVMYGDINGNIAWWAAARLPIRPAHVQSKLFLNGASGEDEYLGYYDFTKNPQSINPPWGFVYSANNQPDSVDGILYPGYYYPRSRAERIVELLTPDKKYTVDDLKTIMLDVTSRMNADVSKLIAGILKESTSASDFTVLINELEQWDGADYANTTAPSIYYNMLSQIIFKAMEDEIGSTALKSLLMTSVPKNSYTQLIGNVDSPWWDNIRTTDMIESREDIVTSAAQKTISLLKQCCGEQSEQWTWGKIHTLTHAHPLGAVKPLDKFFNVGPFVVDGGSEVINNLQFRLDTTGYFPVLAGPALRKITDFSDVENGITVSPTGQSGNVMSAYYSDQAEMFATGKFRKMMMNQAEIEKEATKKLVLKPNVNN